MLTEYLNTVTDPQHPWASIPDSEENILRHLEQYTLDPVFEDCGNFVISNPEWLQPEVAEKYADCTLIFGNFLTFSHAFRLVTDDTGLIQRLTEAINRNKAMPEYQAAKSQMIEQRRQEMERRERLVKQYGNYLGNEAPH